MTNRVRFLVVVIAVVFLTTSVHAEVKLAAIFSNHAVLQRDQPLPVWGWADPGEPVSVSFGNQLATTVADSTGAWRVTLAGQAMSTEPLTLKVVGKNTIEVTDLLLGDVWLCGGQSNMSFQLGACNADEDIRAANFPMIRHFGVSYNFSQSPQQDVEGKWQVCSPQTVSGFSAVGFYFARKIQQETGVPIGLLRSCVGGTNIELWMSQETLLNTPALTSYAERMRNSLADYETELKDSLPKIEAWSAASRQALESGEPIPLPPVWPEFPFGERRHNPRCVTLHNGMIAPLVPMALTGVIWYQGENNAGSVHDGDQYLAKKAAMIADWRKWFNNPDLPFYFVQLAAWQQPNDNAGHVDSWAHFRNAQRRCLTIPHTGMASAVDIGDADDIHPKNKYDVGERLARWALAKEYGKEIETSGPLYRDLKIEQSVARVQFNHTGKGLMIGRKNGRQPVVEDSTCSLQRFAIAGADRKWHWADARIDGDTIVCSSDKVPQPVAVRYAFSTNPAGANLYNRDGLPASPFRSDDW